MALDLTDPATEWRDAERDRPPEELDFDDWLDDWHERMESEMKHELVSLYHVARTALSAHGPEGQGKMSRINWAAEAYHKAHPTVPVVQAKIALYEALA